LCVLLIHAEMRGNGCNVNKTRLELQEWGETRPLGNEATGHKRAFSKGSELCTNTEHVWNDAQDPNVCIQTYNSTWDSARGRTRRFILSVEDQLGFWKKLIKKGKSA
jgi:hypothetical protein